MSEFGGLDVGLPDEGGNGVSEQLSEEAIARFAARAAAIKQLKKEEKKSKRKDDAVVRIIIQFLQNKKNSHLFVLISRLIARNCPSIFVLSVLSLVNEEALTEVERYLEEQYNQSPKEASQAGLALLSTALDDSTNALLVEWITRMQMTLALTPDAIIRPLLLDEKNIDGTLLQLATFIVQDFFKSRQKNLPFESIQPMTASILQTVLAPYIAEIQKRVLAERTVKDEDDD